MKTCKGLPLPYLCTAALTGCFFSIRACDIESVQAAKAELQEAAQSISEMRGKRGKHHRSEQLHKLAMIQNQLRDLREACAAAGTTQSTKAAGAAEAVRGFCRELYKTSRKDGAHRASIDVKAAAGRAFDWAPAMQNILACGEKSFGAVVSKLLRQEALPTDFGFADLWRYQVRLHVTHTGAALLVASVRFG